MARKSFFNGDFAEIAAQLMAMSKPDAPVDPIDRWREELSYLLDDHYSNQRKTGRALAATIIKAAYVPEERKIVCRFRSLPYVSTELVIEESDATGQFLDPYCSCDKNDGLFCVHTYALAWYLDGEFEKTPRSALIRSILSEPKPTWQEALANLDRVLQNPQGLKPVDDLPEIAKPQSRLAWRISILPPTSYRGGFRVEPIEQSPSNSKKGGWNKGRVIRWDRVLRDANLIVIPADYEVVRAANMDSYQNEPYAHEMGAIFEALAGHPLVLLDSTPVTIRRGQAGISVNEHESEWQMTAMLDGRRLTDYHTHSFQGLAYLLAYDETRREVTVARMTQRLTALCQSLVSSPMHFPAECQPEVVKRLQALEAVIPVGLPESAKGSLVPANEQTTLRIHPSASGGAAIDLCVTPAPAGGSYVPGEGAVEVSGRVNDARVRVERDLAAEVQRAASLSEELFLNRFDQSGRFSWKIAKDDEVLDLLDALRARPDNDPIVLWPEDAKSPRMTVLGEVSPAAMKVEIKDQHDWFGLSGTIELGGQSFPLTALLAALRDGRRYISLGKGQYASIAQEFRDRLASVSDMLHNNRGKLEFNATAAPVIADLLDDQLTLKVCKKWKGTLERLNRATELNPQVPATLAAELRDYQVEGFAWLRRLAEWGVGGILADDMGLGKTVQALAVLVDRREVGPALIVAPVSVGFNWQREAERFTPTLRPILYRETDRDEFLKTLGPGDLLITSYHLMQQHAEELTGVKWGTLVLDEAQYIKNSQTKTAQVVRTLEADWRVALTGTPCENHLGDLWSVFRGISPGLFGSWERFREVFADPIEKGKVSERKHALSRVLRPFILRRSKSEVLKELPARTEIQLTAELSAEERKRYEDARLWAVTNLTGLEMETGKDHRFQVLAALTKLRQLACHPRLVDESWDKSSAKLELFLETVDELREAKHRSLVFSQFTSHLALIREALDERKIAYQYLDGQTTPKQRQERVDAFQRGEGEFFLISLKAGGTGLNLTAADYVIHLDPWWNPAVEDQATDRAHRIGQTRPVTVYRLVAKDTIEEQILKLHGDKRHLVAGILDGTDQAAKLSTTELIDLIKLGGRQT